MSLALFHELQGTEQTFDQVVTGDFAAGFGTQYVVLRSHTLSLYRVVEGLNSGTNLRFVTSCRLLGKVHSISACNPDNAPHDSIFVVLRHGVIAVLEYDAESNQFKTSVQHCFGSEAELRPNSSFVSRICRIQGNSGAIQFSPSTLTLFQLLGTEVLSFTIPVSPSSKLALASIDDLVFLPSKTGGVVIAVLGKLEPHAWVGRIASIGDSASVVRMISVDFGRKSVTINWSFESLPSQAFSLVKLPAPKGGLLVVSPDTVSFCEEFSSSVTYPVNKAGALVGSGADKPVHLMNPDKFTSDIDLDGSKQIALSDELVLFACRDRSVLSCHLVRRNGTFTALSDIVWERLESAKPIVPSCLSYAAEASLLLIGSRHGSALLFRVSSTEILLPISVFSATSDEEFKLGEIDTQLPSPLSELVGMYQKEVHDGKITHAVELGLLDELVGSGAVLAIESKRAGDKEAVDGDNVVVSTSSGEIVEIMSCVAAETVFSVNLNSAKFDSNFNFNWRGKPLLVLAGQSSVVLVDCSEGLKEIGKVDLGEAVVVVDIVPRVYEGEGGDVIGVVTSMGLVAVGIVSEKCDTLAVTVVHAFGPDSEGAPLVSSGWHESSLWIARTIEGGVDVLKFENLVQAKKERAVVSVSATITSLTIRVNPESGVASICVSDANGSISIFELSDSTQLSFFSRYVSVCKPLLFNEDPNEPTADSELNAAISVTDSTKRPIEPFSSTSIFAQKIQISHASLQWLEPGSLPVLVVVIDGRPLLVYRQFAVGRFELVVVDSPILAEKSSGRISPSFLPEIGLVVPITPSMSYIVRQSDRGEVLVHPIHGGMNAVSPFESGFVSAAYIALETAENGCTLRIFTISKNFNLDNAIVTSSTSLASEGGVVAESIDLEELEKELQPLRIGVAAAMSVAGLAVVTVVEEVDPGMLVSMLPESTPEEEAAGMGFPQPNGAAEFAPGGEGMDTSNGPATMLLNCPVPPNRQKHRIHILSPSDMKTVTAMIDLNPNEIVTGLTWAASVHGLGADVLVVSTTLLLGEETPAQGRLIVVRVDYSPAVTATAAPPLEEGQQVVGGKIIYDSVKRSAITVVKDWKGCIAVGLGHRLMMYQWDSVAGRLRGVGMIDLGLQITSLAFFKNFIVAGDILRGVYLLRYKEDPVVDMHGVVMSMAASVQLLARTSNSVNIAATTVETVRIDASVGIISIDSHANLDLTLFSPVHFGNVLRPVIPFQLPARTVALATVREASSGLRSVVFGTSSGSICQLVPVHETDHHLASSLSGLMIGLLPQRGGVNPRLHNVAVSRESAGNAFSAVESVDLLLEFLYLSTPLQAEIATRMKQPIDVLMRSVSRWVRHVLP